MTFADHLWQSTLCAALIWASTRGLGRQPARVRHALWRAASLKFLVPFSALLSLGALVHTPVTLSARAVAVTAVATRVGTPFSAVAAFQQPALMTTHPSAPEVRASQPVRVPWSELALAIWAVGMLSILTIRLRAWRLVTQLLRESSVMAGTREHVALHRASTRGRGLREVDLRICHRGIEPAVFGIIRPVMLWPTGLSARLSDPQIESIVAHELAHVRRQDNLLALLHMVVEGLFWFFPVVWWIGRKLIEERERACDETVIALGAEPLAYSEALLVVCRFGVEATPLCASAIAGTDLQRRIEYVMQPVSGAFSLRARLAIVAVAIAIIGAPIMVGAASISPLASVQVLVTPVAAIGGQLMDAGSSIDVPAHLRATPLPALRTSGRQAQRTYDLVLRDSTAQKVIAVADFSAALALTRPAALTISDVVWDDLDFEQAFTMLPRAATVGLPSAASAETLAIDRWSALGVDAVMLGSVTPDVGGGLAVDVQVVGTRGDLARKVIFAKRYSGAGCDSDHPRYCAHQISDDFYRQQGIQGVARTHLAFVSDHGSSAAPEGRPDPVWDVWMSDYDGANARQVTMRRGLTASPSWSPDGGVLAYTSWVSGPTSGPARYPDILLQPPMAPSVERPASGGEDVQNAQPSWSPDGHRLAFASMRRPGRNFNIYVVDRDGSGLRQLTQGDSGDVAPEWSPSGEQIAFVSGRSGKAQLYVMNADGTAVTPLPCGAAECDHPSWSAATNQIAYTCGLSAGAGYDICLLDLGTQRVIRLTDGVGSNEQPSFAPNGRHILFRTTRWGQLQLAMVDLKGTITQLRVPALGNSKYPSWSPPTP
jgi:tol-pal system beta propeller repeat protein TolB